MRKAAALAWVWMLASALVLAQTSPSNPSSQTQSPADPETGQPRAEQPQATTPNSVIVAAGTEIRATLDTPLSTRTSRPGDRFTATIQEPVRAADGGAAIPSGAQIHGEVAQAASPANLPGNRDGGRLRLIFHEVVLPGGSRLPLSATLISVRRTNGTSPAGARPSAAGSIAGLTFDSPAKGLSTEGGAIRTSDGKDVNLPADSGLVLRLEQALNVPATANSRK